MTPEDSALDQGLCPKCGRPIDAHDRHIRFALPDPVLDVPEAEREERTWGNDVLLQVQAVGCFVRVLLPVHLTGGYTVTFGTWLGVTPEDLRRSYEVWEQPAYMSLELEGRLANAVPPWGAAVFAKPASARVRDPNQAPYLESSPDPQLSDVLSREWPHEEVLPHPPD
jgi:hypothetical protein